jgi:hypothetical protein
MLEMINKFTILLPTSQLVALVGNNNYPPRLWRLLLLVRGLKRKAGWQDKHATNAWAQSLKTTVVKN